MKQGAENQKQLEKWIVEVFNLSNEETINLAEHEDEKGGQHFFHTEITVRDKFDQNRQYTIKKSVTEITQKDIQRLRRYVKFERLKKLPVIGNLFRFIGLWIAFTGIYSMFAVCPFCGQLGCPVGAGSAGVVGGFFALVVQNMKNLINFFQKK